MKRRYKQGDWIRIPLGGAHDAIGVIARMCRSRLFGYFFAVDADRDPEARELRSLRAESAVACALFGGAGLEEMRWRVIATSLPFDPPAWPFPQFASRGVFGRTWSAVIYDSQTMSVTARTPIAAEQAASLPDARFAVPEELEALLHLRISGEAPQVPLSVYEVRSPVNAPALRVLERGGRVQFSQLLSERDLDTLAAFIAAHPGVELRVHGIARFELHTVARFAHLRSLVLDVPSVQHAHALAHLQALESLKTGAMNERFMLDALAELPALRRLELHGKNAAVDIAQTLESLEYLTLHATSPIRLDRMRSAERLRTLTIAHGDGDLAHVASLRALERLSLRGMQLASLPDFSRNTRLRAIDLRGIAGLQDLSPLASAPALHELRIEGMAHLQMADFKPLLRCANLRSVTVEIGSKSKTREIYRMLRRAHNV